MSLLQSFAAGRENTRIRIQGDDDDGNAGLPSICVSVSRCPNGSSARSGTFTAYESPIIPHAPHASPDYGFEGHRLRKGGGFSLNGLSRALRGRADARGNGRSDWRKESGILTFLSPGRARTMYLRATRKPSSRRRRWRVAKGMRVGDRTERSISYRGPARLAGQGRYYWHWRTLLIGIDEGISAG